MKIDFIGSMSGHGPGYHGAVFSACGLCPTITTCGGGGTEPHILEVKYLDEYDYGKEQDIQRLADAMEQEGVHNCKLNKMPDGVLGDMSGAQICDIDHPLASTITARYFKGIGANKDNMVMEVSENHLGDEEFEYELGGRKCLIRIRRITPREAWRLMSFSDEDYDKAAEVNSQTQLYKQAGNSIVKDLLVRVMRPLVGVYEQ